MAYEGEREAAEGAAEAVAGLEELVEDELAATRSGRGCSRRRSFGGLALLLLLLVLLEELAGHLGQGERVDGPVDERVAGQRPATRPGSGRG